MYVLYCEGCVVFVVFKAKQSKATQSKGHGYAFVFPSVGIDIESVDGAGL